MRWEIEPSGCCERKGMRQIRICFYLEPGDERYNEHHINAPVIPKSGYPSKKDGRGNAKSEKIGDYSYTNAEGGRDLPLSIINRLAPYVGWVL